MQALRSADGENPISRHVRSCKGQIASVWESLVRAEVPQLAKLERAALIDHLPEFLEGLSHWLEGDTSAARAGFSALAEGHALQRLGYGIDLVTLTREYALLRSTILRELMAVPSAEQTSEWMLRINEGIDAAIHEGVRRYEQLRGPGLRTVLVRVDMGELCKQVIDNRAIVFERSGDLVGMWDPIAIRDVLRRALAIARAVEVREADDRESISITVTRFDRDQLGEAVRDRIIAHGGRWTIAGDRLRLEWPRTPLAETPARI